LSYTNLSTITCIFSMPHVPPTKIHNIFILLATTNENLQIFYSSNTSNKNSQILHYVKPLAKINTNFMPMHLSSKTYKFFSSPYIPMKINKLFIIHVSLDKNTQAFHFQTPPHENPQIIHLPYVLQWKHTNFSFPCNPNKNSQIVHLSHVHSWKPSHESLQNFHPPQIHQQNPANLSSSTCLLTKTSKGVISHAPSQQKLTIFSSPCVPSQKSIGFPSPMPLAKLYKFLIVYMTTAILYKFFSCY